MALEGGVSDIGETLVDETALWQSAADAVAVPRFTVTEMLGIEPPAAPSPGDGLYSGSLTPPPRELGV